MRIYAKRPFMGNMNGSFEEICEKAISEYDTTNSNTVFSCEIKNIPKNKVEKLLDGKLHLLYEDTLEKCYIKSPKLVLLKLSNPFTAYEIYVVRLEDYYKMVYNDKLPKHKDKSKDKESKEEKPKEEKKVKKKKEKEPDKKPKKDLSKEVKESSE